ncbi:hypothetical protein [Thioflexithrix psekupsensis]|uniref:Uncharacterized protein n=1 Tax=Thioflexithrix psekupsensis TaxID=1570016 RepID=A0A251XBS5_9GAMM|nr:hypothetical protein [Thioflexithrix psekupsensis]OUD16028.1 hypothetical protein TPSD3_01090 [Thioflexithrix psekupsensis]
MDIQQLKTIYISQIKDDFTDQEINPNYFNALNSGVNLLFKAVYLERELAHLFISSLEDVLGEKSTDYNAFAAFVTYLEKYLKFICKTSGLKSEYESLSGFIKTLFLDNASFPCHERKDIKKLSGQAPLREFLCTAHCARLDVAHAKEKQQIMPNWCQNQVEILKNRNAVLMVFVLATLKYQEALKAKIRTEEVNNEPSIKSYLEKVVQKFSSLENGFVELNCAGNGYRGNVLELWKKTDGKRFFLFADAGMGKTTTLQYMVLQEAKVV